MTSRSQAKVTLDALMVAAAHANRSPAPPERRPELAPVARDGSARELGLAGCLLAALLIAIHDFRAAGFDGDNFADQDFAARNFDDDNFTDWPSGPTQLLGLDYTEPKQQAFPTTPGGVIAGRTATEILDFTEASGNLTGEVASTVFTAAGSPRYGTVAVGMFAVTDCYSVKGIGFDAGADNAFTAPAATDYDYDDTASLAFSWIMRSAPGATNGIFGKRNTSGAFEGYECYVASGRIWLRVDTGASDAVCASPVANNVSDGAWHECRAEINKTAGTITTYVDGAAGTPVSLPAGSASSTVLFAIGKQRLASSQFDMTYLAIFEGAHAEGIVSDTALLTHGTDPGTGGIFPTLDTYTRATLACPVVGFEPGFGDRVAKYGPGQVAHNWRSGYSHASKLGLLIEDAATNLVKQSEDWGTSWSQVSQTLSANSGEAPDGTYTADSLTATAANGRSASDGIVLATATQYTLSVWIKRNGGSDVTGSIYLRNLDTPGYQGTQAFTATDEWSRVDLQVTTDAVGVSYSFWIDIDTNTESIFVWGAQVETGAYATSYIPTTSAAATRNHTDCQLDNPGGNTYLKSAAGEVQVVTALDVHDSTISRQLFLAAGAGAGDKLSFVIASSEKPNVVLWDVAAVIKQNIIADAAYADMTAEHTHRARWDSQADFHGYAENGDLFADTTRKAGTDVTWSTGVNATSLEIGHDGNSNAIGGSLATLDIWDAPRADSP